MKGNKKTSFGIIGKFTTKQILFENFFLEVFACFFSSHLETSHFPNRIFIYNQMKPNEQKIRLQGIAHIFLNYLSFRNFKRNLDFLLRFH